MSTNAVSMYTPNYYYYNENGKLIGQKTQQDFFNGLNNGNVYSTSSMTSVSSDYRVDDGKISTGSKIVNFLKGLVKPVTSMFSSPKNFLKGVLGIAACAGLCWITGGAAAPYLVAAGVIGGGVKLTKGAINASNATTDAEAEAAWQDMGSGTFMVGASVIGAKAAAKAANSAGVAGFEGAENAGTLSSLKMCLKPSNLINAGKVSLTNAGTNIAGCFGSLKGKNSAPKTETETAPKTETETATKTETETALKAEAEIKTIEPNNDVKDIAIRNSNTNSQISNGNTASVTQNNPNVKLLGEGSSATTTNGTPVPPQTTQQTSVQQFAQEMLNGGRNRQDIMQFLRNSGKPRDTYRQLQNLVHPNSSKKIGTGDSTIITDLSDAYHILVGRGTVVNL